MNLKIKKQNSVIFIFIFLLYLILAFFLSDFYLSVPYIPYYSSTIDWIEFSFSIFLTLVIAILTAVNGVQIYKNFKKISSSQKGISCAGTVIGLTTGVCSTCVAGFFPFIFGIVGISFSYLSLPFKGLEIKMLSIILLLIGFYFLKKEKK